MIIRYSEISVPVVAEFFRIFDNREEYITVCNDEDLIIGYLSLKEAAVFIESGTLKLSMRPPINHQSNFHSYQIALSVLPAYVSNFKEYLCRLGIKSIGIDANFSDYKYIQTYIPELNLLRCEDNPNIVFDVVLILRCPISLQHYLFGTSRLIKISDIFESFLLTDFLKFVKKNYLCSIFIEGPVADKIVLTQQNKYIHSRISIEEILNDEEFISQFCLGDKDQIDYINNSEYGVLSGNRIITNGISLRSGYFSSAKLNVNNYGERKSLSAIKKQSYRDIFVFGSCLTFGLFTNDEKTPPSYLQKLINESASVSGVVHNMGVKGKALFINDLLLAMQSEVKRNDILIFVSPLSPSSISILRENNVEYFDFSEYLNKKKNPNCLYLNNTYHSNIVVYEELAKYIFELISNHVASLSPSNTSIKISGFAHNGKIGLFDQRYIWKHIFLKKYLKFLDSLPKPSIDSIVGSILITANPFTLGHAFLIQKALEYCDFLYVFVLESDAFQFTFVQRFEMVERYCEQEPRCCVVPSGDIWGSKDLFPEYFNRCYTDKTINITPEESYIFCKFIAPKLGITKRFIGDEKHDYTTYQYNMYLKKYLPFYGISVIQFERKQNIHGEEIKGKTVRSLISSKHIDEDLLLSYVPKSTIEVIRRYEKLI